MPEAADRVRHAVARWDGVDADAVEVREQVGRHGTLVLVAGAATPGDSDDDRWFSARAIYVDAQTRELFRLPSHAAFMPRAEEYLADPGNRARTTIEEDA
jgi:hypothetical protein